MIIKRNILGEVIHNASIFPVITITGPRQSGKTTLIKQAFPEKKYFSLEDPDILLMAKEDPRQFLSGNKNGMILDEIQNAPFLLSYIQSIVDENDEAGQFILSGSQQFELMSKISQSLAGRTSILKLLPFSLDETNEFGFFQIDELLYTGFYPRIWDKKLPATTVYRNYYETYIQRDLRQLINIKDLSQFRRFLQLCAGRIGQIFIANQLANEIGVSSHTINSWLSILETSYITFQLPPYFTNTNKRLIKSKKIFFYDVGLASYLLGIAEPEQIKSHPLRGALFENMVITEIIKYCYNNNKDFNLFFYRDSNHNEIDVIIDHISGFDAIEIKSTSTFHRHLTNGLNHIKKIHGDKVKKSILVYAGDTEQLINDNRLINFRNLVHYL